MSVLYTCKSIYNLVHSSVNVLQAYCAVSHEDIDDHQILRNVPDRKVKNNSKNSTIHNVKVVFLTNMNTCTVQLNYLECIGQVGML